MQFVDRAGWDAEAPKHRDVLRDKDVKGMAVHYSGSGKERKLDHNECANTVRAIQHYHMRNRGWFDVAYSFLVCWHGFTFEGRGWGIRTGANGTDFGNDHWLAVCFLGGDADNRDDVTDVGRRAIWEVSQECERRYNAAEHVPHSKFKNTGCPGDELRMWLEAGMPVNIPPPPAGVIVSNAPVICTMVHEAWGTGYIQVAEDGGCFHFNTPDFIDKSWSLGGTPLNDIIVGAVPTPSGRGYKLTGRDGGDFNFGDSVHHGRVEYRS